ncbi:Shikimate/quinate 5-dehydrogenase [Desulforamulus hydrothermalis]|uniref:Shikimate/quinate 5-dehydrogenase n=1 Tax=Desulforamulus hydrothermalis Lam5 = DSM 18033 TaxID=1121428 RepID=K8DZU8_9FIRM|nr:Shikimate/quinate 5-dehydrogenase [Desulforamulus hydrothermalis]CCO08689.1 Shikimate/quinate 5-dehydrogenase [Desulforamulus hydrothermalis Lam5 = DSM 18033]SHH38484.1 Predicted amino acid dehydrogenase [Desulforamulus hydrothermalis Lam5 = DSM 18033]
MNQFAFIIHPLDVSDVARKFGFTRYMPDALLEQALKLLPPVKISSITGIRSAVAETEGFFVSCLLTARQMMSLPQPFVLNKIIQAGRLAEKLGAKVIGLGAFSKVVGDAGITVAKQLKIPVTTGNSYTIAMALEGAKKAAQLMGHDLKRARVTVVGATGSIGSVCALALARDVKHLTLVGRNEAKLYRLADRIMYETGLAAEVTAHSKAALRQADLVLTVTGSLDAVIEPEDLKPGAVVCDVARPRDVSRRVAEERDDVLVIEGGIVEVPGDVNFNFNFGFPPKTAYACMAETMILALEGRLESYTLGRELTLQQVEEIYHLGKKHGFKLAGFRSFEKPISEQEINLIKQRAIIKVS